MAGREIAPKSSKSPELTRSGSAENHGVPADNVGRGSDAPDGVTDLGMPSHALCTETGRPRQGPAAMVGGRHGREGDSRNPQQSSEESDALVVPTCEKSTKTWVTPAESMEGRSAANGKPALRNASPAQDGQDALTYLERVGQRAKEKKEERFNNLLSHIKVPLLKEAYQRLRKDAAPGVDGVTWGEYRENLDARLLDLQDRVHRGSYHPQPVRRVHIPKGDGISTRPLGIPSLEDKLVQQAARMLLEPIYEREFLGFSYGFRPGRSPHQALDALAVAIGRKVDWVLDADIRAFFDTIDHAWMQKFIEHKIADTRLVRLLMKWLHAGVMEDGKVHEVQEGTPQGGIISPLLANIYLHYVLDLWVSSWRKTHAHGEVYVVRYADDFVMGFQREQDGREMRKALAERLATFGLELHPDKTRVIRFGRFAHRDSRLDGRTRPETFDFLGFTHIIALGPDGTRLIRRTSRKKRKAKLASLRRQMRDRRHEPPGTQHAWLSSVLRGHYGYYGVPCNSAALASFYRHVRRSWHRSLQERSQRACWSRERRAAFEARFPLPLPRITRPPPRLRPGP
jgi:RNA-directed DNA polymerase